MQVKLKGACILHLFSILYLNFKIYHIRFNLHNNSKSKRGRLCFNYTPPPVKRKVSVAANMPIRINPLLTDSLRPIKETLE